MPRWCWLLVLLGVSLLMWLGYRYLMAIGDILEEEAEREREMNMRWGRSDPEFYS